MLLPWLSCLRLSPLGGSCPDSAPGRCTRETQAPATLSPTSPHLSSPVSKARKCQRAYRKATTASNIQVPGSQLSPEFHFLGLFSASLRMVVRISTSNVIGKWETCESKLEFDVVWINIYCFWPAISLSMWHLKALEKDLLFLAAKAADWEGSFWWMLLACLCPR